MWDNAPTTEPPGQGSLLTAGLVHRSAASGALAVAQPPRPLWNCPSSCRLCPRKGPPAPTFHFLSVDQTPQGPRIRGPRRTVLCLARLRILSSGPGPSLLGHRVTEAGTEDLEAHGDPLDPPTGALRVHPPVPIESCHSAPHTPKSPNCGVSCARIWGPLPGNHCCWFSGAIDGEGPGVTGGHGARV